MISFIEKNYFKINLLFLSVISFYCMAGLIVPLQAISANKFVTLGMTLMGVLLGLYNFFIKKAYLTVRKIEYLILFFIKFVDSCDREDFSFHDHFNGLLGS